MALTGALAGARLVALDTSPFIYLIEKNATFFSAVVPERLVKFVSLSSLRVAP